jgi:hypothetical protein
MMYHPFVPKTYLCFNHSLKNVFVMAANNPLTDQLIRKAGQSMDSLLGETEERLK